MICKQCKFFKWVYQQDAVVVDDINKTAGFCLRYPPVIIPAVEWTDGMDRDEYLALSSAWPIIDSTEWCGEFKSNKTMEDKARLLAAIKYDAANLAAKKEANGEFWEKRDQYVARQYKNITGVWPDHSLKNVLPQHNPSISRYLLSKRIAYLKATTKTEQPHV